MWWNFMELKLESKHIWSKRTSTIGSIYSGTFVDGSAATFILAYMCYQAFHWPLTLLTFIENITGISPTVIFGNKIQKFCLVTSDVTSDNWSVTSYVTDRSPVGVYVHARLPCLWRHHGEIIKHKVDHKQKSGNVTGRVIRKQNPRPFGGVTERDLRKQNP